MEIGFRSLSLIIVNTFEYYLQLDTDRAIYSLYLCLWFDYFTTIPTYYSHSVSEHMYI